MDANHQQSETNLRCIEIIKQRDATIKEIIERYNLLLKQLNGTAQWATKNEKENTIAIRGEKL